jgi:PPOX class probable F420-dependent enzyme
MAKMSEQRWREFVTERPRTAKLGVVRADGRPHIAPIWTDLDDDGTVVFNTGKETIKGKAILRDPRVCLCFDDETPPFAFVIIDGTAEVSEEPAELLHWATRIAARYMGAERADEYGMRNAVPGELLVRVRPDRIVAREGISD